MKFKIRFAEQIVGVFILAAIVGIAVLMIFIGINQRWFARNYMFTSRFETAEGLSVGMPVRLKGFQIGTISRVSLNAQNQVDIVFSIQDTYYDKVLPNSLLQLATSPIGLGSTLQFLPGKDPAPPLPEMSFIPSLDSEEGRDLVAKGLVTIPKGEDAIGSVIAKVNPLLDEARSAIAQIRQVANTVDAGIAGRSGPLGQTITRLSTTPDKVNSAVDGISTRANTLLDKISVISDDLAIIAHTTSVAIGPLAGNLTEITQNVKALTDDLKNTQGLVKRLLDPKGSVATFLDDKNVLYDKVDRAIESADRIIEQLQVFVQYVNDSRPQITSILEKGSTTLDEGRDVLEAVKNNPLLKGGVPQRLEQTSTQQSYRDEDF